MESAHPPQLVVVYAESPTYIPITSVTLNAQMQPTLGWSSTSNATYTVERNTNLVSGTWEPIDSDIEATPPANTFHDHSSTNATFPLFYRITTP